VSEREHCSTCGKVVERKEAIKHDNYDEIVLSCGHRRKFVRMNPKEVVLGSDSVTGRKVIPKPFNENDVMVWNALICKYICKNKNGHFNRSDFLNNMIEDRITPIGAYNKEMIRKTNKGEKNEFYYLMKYCLEFLRTNRMLELRSETDPRYFTTNRLRSMCPQIANFIIPSIEPVLEAEKEIRKRGDNRNVLKLLGHLEKSNEITQSDTTKYITINELNNLLKLGIIVLYLNGKITMTPLGGLVKPLLD